jgi:hypothetical protein
MMTMARPTTKNSGARYEIAVDGTPRSYRDMEKMAIEATTYLNTKQPHSVITARDIERGKTTAVKHPSVQK